MKVIIILGLLFSLPVLGQDYFSDQFIKENLQKFETNPKAFMNATALKKFKTPSKFSNQNHSDNFSDNSFIKTKLQNRSQILSTSTNFNAIEKGISVAPAANDKVENLVEGIRLIRNINEMQTKNLLTGEVTTRPWSDDYWPIFKGILGARYADEEFDYFSNWKEAYTYVETNPALAIFQTQQSDAIDKLSPAEKYDLLLGGQHFILTQRGWAEGKRYVDANGEVERWMGICHGWAPASYMIARPQKKVTVMAHDGITPITFYPADIKALASLLWANTQTATRFVGGRCNKQNPEQDENGRNTDPDCVDTNPATWHMAVVNQIGIKKSSMVMDATYDYEVWNQPIIGYQYKYFNPETKEPVTDIQKAIIALSDYKSDKFKKYRDSKTKFVIGISMEVTYGVETSPLQRENDLVEYDAQNYAYYDYDLELDKDANIIGGEWYRNTHPDFLWTPDSGARAMTYGDYYLLSAPNWNGKTALPDQWRQIGQSIAYREGAPLAKIVESLIELSNSK